MDFQQALDEVLKETGYMQLKSKQQEAIEAFVSGKDVFVSLPTGYGKSVIYQNNPCQTTSFFVLAIFTVQYFKACSQTKVSSQVSFAL